MGEKSKYYKAVSPQEPENRMTPTSPKPTKPGNWNWYPDFGWIDEDKQWIDPAGGLHNNDEEDPAKMYE
jgi:hypothetical protein